MKHLTNITKTDITKKAALLIGASKPRYLNILIFLFLVVLSSCACEMAMDPTNPSDITVHSNFILTFAENEVISNHTIDMDLSDFYSIHEQYDANKVFVYSEDLEDIGILENRDSLTLRDNTNLVGSITITNANSPLKSLDFENPRDNDGNNLYHLKRFVITNVDGGSNSFIVGFRILSVDALIAIGDLRAIPASNAIGLKWTDPTHATFSHLLVSWTPDQGMIDSSATQPVRINKNETKTIITGLINSTNYFITVKSVDTNDNESSNVAVSSTPAIPNLLLDNSEEGGCSGMVGEETTNCSFTVALSAEPLEDVGVSLSLTTDDRLTSPTEVTFTTDNWNTPQRVTVGIQDDFTIQTNIMITLTTTLMGYRSSNFIFTLEDENRVCHGIPGGMVDTYYTNGIMINDYMANRVRLIDGSGGVGTSYTFDLLPVGNTPPDNAFIFCNIPDGSVDKLSASFSSTLPFTDDLQIEMLKIYSNTFLRSTIFGFRTAQAPEDNPLNAPINDHFTGSRLSVLLIHGALSTSLCCFNEFSGLSGGDRVPYDTTMMTSNYASELVRINNITNGYDITLLLTNQ